MVLKFMKKTVFAVMGLPLVALFSVTSPASAVGPAPFLNPSITIAGDTPTSGTNAAPVIATMTTDGTGIRKVNIQAANWEFVNQINSPSACPSWFTVTTSPTAGTPTCQTGLNGTKVQLMIVTFPSDVATGTTVTYTIASGAMTASSAGQQFYFFGMTSGGSPVNQSTVNLPAPPAPAPAPAPTPEPDPTLAKTGVDAQRGMQIALLLLSAGGLTILIARRGYKLN